MDSARRWHGRRIISFILVFVAAVTSVAAADDVYSVRADTKAFSADRSTGNWTAFDYGYISSGAYSTHPITSNEDFWQYTNHSLARGLADLYNRLDLILSADNSINSKFTTTNDSISSLIVKLWGSSSTSPITVYRMNTSWDGSFGTQQVYNIADALALDSINNMYAAYWSKLNNEALWSIQSGVNTVNSSVGSVNSSLGTVNSSIGTLNSSLGTVNTNLGIIDSSLGTVNTNLGTVNTNLVTVNTNLGTVDSDLDLLTSKVFDNSSPSGNSAYYHTGVLQYSSVAYPSYLVTTTNGYKVATGGDMGTVTSLRDYLDLINRNLIVQANMLFNFDRNSNPYTQDRYNLTSHSSSSSTVRSIADSLTYGFSDLSNFTGRLAAIFASDDDIQAREDADPQIQQAQDDFISPDGAASVKLRDMGSAKDVSSSLQGTLDTGVSPATAFSYFGTNGGLFSFFSDDCKSNLDSAPVTRSSEEYLDFYTPNFRQIGVAFDD